MPATYRKACATQMEMHRDDEQAAWGVSAGLLCQQAGGKLGVLIGIAGQRFNQNGLVGQAGLPGGGGHDFGFDGIESGVEAAGEQQAAGIPLSPQIDGMNGGPQGFIHAENQSNVGVYKLIGRKGMFCRFHPAEVVHLAWLRLKEWAGLRHVVNDPVLVRMVVSISTME